MLTATLLDLQPVTTVPAKTMSNSSCQYQDDHILKSTYLPILDLLDSSP